MELLAILAPLFLAYMGLRHWYRYHWMFRPPRSRKVQSTPKPGYIQHEWHSDFIASGTFIRLHGTDFLPTDDALRIELIQLAIRTADAEFGRGKWQFVNIDNPDRLCAYPKDEY
jgi:hypothetical protein